MIKEENLPSSCAATRTKNTSGDQTSHLVHLGDGILTSSSLDLHRGTRSHAELMKEKSKL